MTTGNPLLTAAEVAAKLGVKYSAIRAAIASAILEPQRVGRYDIFPARDLDAIREKLVAGGLVKSPANQ